MTTKPRSKWDVPPRRGEYDHLLKEIRDEVERITPPPPPPEEPPRQPRVRVEIEITEKRRQSPRRSWTPAIVGWLLVLVVLAMAVGCAHAQQPPRYDHWYDTNGWHGETVTQGGTTDWRAYGPNGQQKHCHAYNVGNQTYTNCN